MIWERQSKWGLAQATGTLSVWGIERVGIYTSDTNTDTGGRGKELADAPRALLLGGNWNNGGFGIAKRRLEPRSVWRFRLHWCSLCGRAPCDLLRGATAPTAMTAKRATAQPGKEAHGLYMLEKYERVIEYLYPIAQNICAFVETEMGQRIGKWHLAPVLRGFTFCGFRIRTKFKLIKRQSMIRQRRRIRHLLSHDDHAGWRRSVIAWMGHIRHGDGQNGLVHLKLALPC